MLRFGSVARAVTRAVTRGNACRVAVGGGRTQYVNQQKRGKHQMNLYGITNKMASEGPRNSPDFGFVNQSDFDKSSRYIKWETLHPSKLKEVVKTDDSKLYSDDELTIRRMFECGIHYGHETSMWNPLISQFLYGHRHGIHIFNLEETLKCLRSALTFLRGVAQRGGIILFVNTRPQFESIVRTTAIESGEYYITQKWVPGIITNRLRAFEQDVKPDCVVFLSMPVNGVGVDETLKGSVPSIGICDSDCNPSKVLYPIPGNDDGIDPMRFYCSLMKSAILDGKKHPITPPSQDLPNTNHRDRGGDRRGGRQRRR